jgi:hypothetical protein
MTRDMVSSSLGTRYPSSLGVNELGTKGPGWWRGGEQHAVETRLLWNQNFKNRFLNH